MAKAKKLSPETLLRFMIARNTVEDLAIAKDFAADNGFSPEIVEETAVLYALAFFRRSVCADNVYFAKTSVVLGNEVIVDLHTSYGHSTVTITCGPHHVWKAGFYHPSEEKHGIARIRRLWRDKTAEAEILRWACDGTKPPKYAHTEKALLDTIELMRGYHRNFRWLPPADFPPYAKRNGRRWLAAYDAARSELASLQTANL